MVVPLPDGVRALHAVSADGYRAIIVSRSLPPVERLAALAHELAHDDCQGGCHHPGMPDLLRPIVARDEARVDRVAADRLLPLPRLAAWVTAEVAAERPVTVALAAAGLDVAHWVAEVQLRRLWDGVLAGRQVA